MERHRVWDIKRTIVIEYDIKVREMIRYHPHIFAKFVGDCKKNDVVKTRRKGCPTSTKSPEANQLDQQEAEESPMQSIRKVAETFNSSKTTINDIIQNERKMKLFKLHRCQELTKDHKNYHLPFSHLILEYNKNQHKIMFPDEKSASTLTSKILGY